MNTNNNTTTTNNVITNTMLCNNNDNITTNKIKKSKGNPFFKKGNRYASKEYKSKVENKKKELREVVAREFAAQILATDPKTGKVQDVDSIRKRLAREAAKSPRILNLFIDHWLGQPPQVVHQESRIIVMPELPAQYQVPALPHADMLPLPEQLPAADDIKMVIDDGKVEEVDVSSDDIKDNGNHEL